MFRKLIPSIVLIALILSLFGTFRPVSANVPTGSMYFEFYASAKANVDWNWNIHKSASTTSEILSIGQTFPVTYTVDLAATPTLKDLWIGGVVKATNNTSETVDVTSVVVTPPDGGTTLSCATSVTLAPGEKVECYFTYPFAAIDSVEHVIHAEVVTTAEDFSESKSVYLTNPVVLAEFDECVDVTDSAQGVLGQICATDAQKTFTFTYTKNFTYDACGEYDFHNTASYASTQTPAETGSSSADVHFSVPCAGGCSLTPGYWKTHSAYGPSKYDNAWAQIGEDTAFFSSGQSYYQVLWTAPQGNAYYILAHAYIAAVLNGYNGADTSAVASQITFAASFFASHGPTDTLTKAERQAVLSAATALDNYNNGLIGPGHCTE
jgi:hypothetical protein